MYNFSSSLMNCTFIYTMNNYSRHPTIQQIVQYVNKNICIRLTKKYDIFFFDSTAISQRINTNNVFLRSSRLNFVNHPNLVAIFSVLPWPFALSPAIRVTLLQRLHGHMVKANPVRIEDNPYLSIGLREVHLNRTA